MVPSNDAADPAPAAAHRESPPPPPSPNGAAAQLTARASALWRKGHPWFYRDDLVGAPPAEPSLVRVQDHDGRALGLAFASPRGKLALRACGDWDGAVVPDRGAFFAARIGAAVARRAAFAVDAGVRLVHGESDDLPGLVVDRYGPVVVIQVTAGFVEQALDAVVPVLAALPGVEAVVARNDVSVRRLEELPREVRLLHGRRVEQVAITENGVRFTVQPFVGHKTGFYLDQRPARALVQQLARGRTVLDLFSYQGGFALAALRGGATAALAVDQSAPALELAQQDAAANGLAGLEVQRANAFDFLRALRQDGRQFELIVLDPPAFAKSRREVRAALRGYRDLNRQALRLLAPGGHLLTCSCSHHATPPLFEETVRQAAAGLPFKVALEQRLGAGADHPAWLQLPESEYLKVLLLRRMD
ncbi:MAG: class I SAM-dependent rRNA methyltransferase [Planctomycetota bacterium]